MATKMSVEVTFYNIALITNLSLFVTLTVALASSLPPENQQMDLHSGQIEHKSTYFLDPIEEMHNSLLQEVEPHHPLPTTGLPLSSGKKELDDDGPALIEEKDVLLRNQPSRELDQEDLTTPATALLDIEVKPLNKHAEKDCASHLLTSAIVPRKGVGDMPSSVVARKGAEFNTSEVSLEPEFVATTSNEENIVVTIGPPTKTPLYQTTTFSSFIARAPANDIPKPPIKQVTTDQSTTLVPPSSSLAYAPSSLSYALPPPPASLPTKHVSKHLKPAVAVDAVNNKPFDSTPVIMGVTFGVLLIVILAIIAYKKLQDVWSRRHYDRMDFLIDGMYDL